MVSDRFGLPLEDEMPDGVWDLRGDPQQVERIMEFMREADERMRSANAWMLVREPLSSHWVLPATTDRDPRALATKFLYALRNRVNRLPGGRTWRCWREGYICEWHYPYGFVPEAGCPRHD